MNGPNHYSDPSEYNVVLITLDSCTLETARKAKTPSLDAIGPLHAAEANATFTYPAHHAFFLGHLPIIKGGEHYFQNYSKIWRSSNASEYDHRTAIRFEGRNIIDHYEHRGFNVRGYGGVSFFNTHRGGNSLPDLFTNFKYFGPDDASKPCRQVPRLASSFPLNNLSIILDDIHGERPFFVFINSIATHIPYDHAGSEISKEYEALIKRLYEEHYSQRMHPSDLPFSAAEIDKFKQRQVAALEWADAKIGELAAKIPHARPTLFVIFGDHGEEFGEGGRFGHAHNHDSVMRVPLWCGVMNGDHQ